MDKRFTDKSHSINKVYCMCFFSVLLFYLGSHPPLSSDPPPVCFVQVRRRGV